MNSFFSDTAKIAILQAAAKSWLKTPFMPNACVKGAGVSCQKLAGAIYQETGVLAPGVQIPDGPMDWSNAHKDSLIVKFMESRPEFQRITGTPEIGDMLGFHIAGCVQHCGIVITADGKFIHCYRDAVTRYNNFRDATYLSRIEYIWRPML